MYVNECKIILGNEKKQTNFFFRIQIDETINLFLIQRNSIFLN